MGQGIKGLLGLQKTIKLLENGIARLARKPSCNSVKSLSASSSLLGTIMINADRGKISMPSQTSAVLSCFQIRVYEVIECCWIGSR